MTEDTKEGTPVSIESEPFIRHYSRGFNPSRLLKLTFYFYAHGFGKMVPVNKAAKLFTRLS